MKKIMKWSVVLVLLLLVVGGLVTYLNLNRIVKRTVESQGTASLNLKTELDSARLALFGGKLSLDDLKIASPQGFAAPQMLTLGGADVAVKLGELRSDPVRVSSITLNQPKLVIENVGGKLNFKRAMELMPQTPEQQTPADAEKPLMLIIDDLTIKDATVVVRPGLDIPGLKLAEEIVVPIPSVTLKNIGTADGASNGAAVKDVVMQVITVMAANAANSGKLPDQLKDLMNVDLKEMVAGFGKQAQARIAAALPGDVGKAVAGLLDDPNALLKNPGEAIAKQRDALQSNVTNEVQNRVGNLLGGPASTQPTGATQPAASQPVDRVKEEAGRRVEQGLQGLFNRDKKK